MTPEHLLSEADRCVKCGLCLPHCPTYRLLASEADSPRGRISLMQALAKGELGTTSRLGAHLDRCLGCRACESACPSGVRYAQLLDASRTLMRQQMGTKQVWKRLLEPLIRADRLARWIRVYAVLERLHIPTLLRMLPVPSVQRTLSLARQLNPRTTRPGGLYPSATPTGRLVQLFTGCVAPHVEHSLMQAALNLLHHLGYAVEVPRGQVCCGALQRHNGFEDEADALCQENRAQTRKSRAECLITLASACHLELSEHQASELPLLSIVDFLLDLPTEQFPVLSPLPCKAALHVPCSAREDRSQELLGRIPDLELVPLPENSLCCGAAGSYLVMQPELSRQLGRKKIKHLKATGARLLLTTNTGCALQFRELIAEAGLTIEVLHPAELILRQWLGQAGGFEQG
ncbi:MAG: (Fe-S)-binding protein [Candidatus Thiodiazotropha sp.]